MGDGMGDDSKLRYFTWLSMVEHVRVVTVATITGSEQSCVDGIVAGGPVFGGESDREKDSALQLYHTGDPV